MKDITLRNATQEKNDKISQKCFYLERLCRAGRLSGATLRYLTVHRFRQSDILRSMPVSVHTLEQAHTQVRAGMLRRPEFVMPL
jgi:hypothetical protein